MPSTVLRRVTVTVGLLAALTATGGCAAEPAPEVTAADVVGSWGTSTTEQQAYLIIEDDGTVVGSDGCNRLRATWQVGGSGVSFSSWSGPTAACPQVDGWLGAAVAARLEDGDLLLVDRDNLNLGTLQPTH